ncbi:hypothetical protein JCM1841_006964 [Sporobolomyces salmonicolor]
MSDRYDTTKVKKYLQYQITPDGDTLLSYTTLDDGYREVIAGPAQGHDNGLQALADFVALVTKGKHTKWEDLPKPPPAKFDLTLKRRAGLSRKEAPTGRPRYNGVDISSIPPVLLQYLADCYTPGTIVAFPYADATLQVKTADCSVSTSERNKTPPLNYDQRYYTREHGYQHDYRDHQYRHDYQRERHHRSSRHHDAPYYSSSERRRSASPRAPSTVTSLAGHVQQLNTNAGTMQD